MLTTIIIDDDFISRMVLREMLMKSIKDINILGEAGSVEEGLALIEQVKPEVVFLDISMPDGTGFDLLDRIETVDFKIIFITAYSEYAIKAFKYSAFDYIVKPLKIQELKKTISRIPLMPGIENKNRVNKLKENFASIGDGSQKTIALPEQNGFAIINVEDIIRCEGKRNYTRIIFKEKDEKIVSRTLLEFEILLSPLGFIRIHRSHLVKITNIIRYIKAHGGLVELKTGELLKVSVKYKEDVLNVLLNNKV